MAEPVLDNEDIKKRATRRLFVAVALVGIAAGILTWLSNYRPSAPITTRPAPDTAVPPPIIAAEPTPIAPAEQPAPAPPPAAQSTPDTGQPPAPPPTLGAPPPPKVVSQPLPPPGPGPKTAPPEPAEPLIRAEQQAAAQPPAPASQPPHSPAGYVVQFGVFSNPQNALQLVERLKQAGIAAQTETRVQLPPFKTKAEADAALAKLKEKGVNAVIVAH